MAATLVVTQSLIEHWWFDSILLHARMVEMVYTPGLGSGVREDVQVRLLFRALSSFPVPALQRGKRPRSYRLRGDMLPAGMV